MTVPRPHEGANTVTDQDTTGVWLVTPSDALPHWVESVHSTEEGAQAAVVALTASNPRRDFSVSGPFPLDTTTSSPWG